MLGREGDESETEVFKREVDEEEKGVRAAMGNDGDICARQEIVKEKEMEVKTGGNEFLCSNRAGEKSVSATLDETWLR